jgi:hypothetical protein
MKNKEAISVWDCLFTFIFAGWWRHHPGRRAVGGVPTAYNASSLSHNR